jgi:hypothetical protein
LCCCWAAGANDALVLLLMVVSLLLVLLLLLRSSALSCTAGAVRGAPGFGSMLLLPQPVTAAMQPACGMNVDSRDKG